MLLFLVKVLLALFEVSELIDHQEKRYNISKELILQSQELVKVIFDVTASEQI